MRKFRFSSVTLSWRGFIQFFVLFVLGLYPATTIAAGMKAGGCGEFLKLLLQYQNQLQVQFEQFPLGDGSTLTLPVFDSEIGNILQQGFNSGTQAQVVQNLIASQTYDVPVQANGAVVAAPTSGGYGKAIWTRDLARVFEGLLKDNRRDEAKKVAKALLAAMSTESQMKRLYDNIRYPHLHFEHAGQMKVLHIRLDAKTLDSLDEEWNHKQNDAVALSFLAILQAFREGLLTTADLSDNERKYLTALPAYFQALRYWEMHDAGAWEEWTAIRASSVGLVAKVFEELLRFHADPNIEEFSRMIHQERASAKFPDDLKNKIKDGYSHASLVEAHNFGVRLVKDYLKRGESPDMDHGEKDRKRFADAALSHLFWYPLDALNEDDFRLIIYHIRKIQRESGILRYNGDMYLHTLYYFGREWDGSLIPQDFLKSNDPRTLHDVYKVFNPRNPTKAAEYFGDDLDARWCIHDAIMARAGLFMFKRYGRDEYFQMAKEFSIRSYLQVSGREALPSLDGTLIAPRKLPESRSKIILYRQPGSKIEIHLFVPSNNSPLYWATAEQMILNREWKDFWAMKPTR